ncbi:hypothetical protein MNBD_GAMMA01-2247 [hydrothermal vent metagenome]|uniref:P/Homo B domain-containing protein n=1 Tax=hydrothermal vent metagenome TaxID=652676 RepID=A0A3B0WEQ6_9ZZZZ
MKKILILALMVTMAPAVFAQTFTYTGAPDAFIDNDLASPLCTDVAIAAATTVSSANFVSVDFAITHTWLGDLDMTLTSPAATVVALRDRAAINGAGFGDDSNLDAATSLSFFDTSVNLVADMGAACGNAAIVGVDPACPETDYAPSSPLAAFNGESAAGNWTLCVGDGAAGDLGTLTSWSIVGDGTLPVELQSFSID